MMELVDEQEMPLKSNLVTHSEARLSDAQRKEIVEWAGEVKKVIKTKEP